METKGRRGYRTVEPPLGEPPLAEPPLAESPLAEPPLVEPRTAEPIEKPTPMAEPAERSIEIPLEPAPAGASALTDATASAAVDQMPADEPEVQVPPPILAAAPRLAAPLDQAADLGGEAMAVFAETRSALADAVKALSEEVAGLARRGIETAARTAVEMLAVKTVADVLVVNAGFARASFGNWLGSSAKLSELGLRLAAESSRPFSERLAKGRIGVRRASP